MPDAKAKLQHAELQIIVTRADGTVEDHGVVAVYDRNPLKRAWWFLKTKGRR